MENNSLKCYVTTITICIMIATITFVLSEMASYLWHRYFAHRSIFHSLFPAQGFLTSHKLHHESSLNHHADEDFVWIILILTIGILGIGVLFSIGLLPRINPIYIVVIFATVIVVFLLNWYVHKAIHTEGHWLQKFKIVRDLRDIHFVHHKNPRENYAILNFSDVIFGTTGCGFKKTE